MPCRDYPEDHNADARNAHESARAARKRCDALAKMLCEACGIIDNFYNEGIELEMGTELAEWWNEHQKADRANLISMLARRVNHLDKDDFDRIDEILSQYNDE